MLKHLFLATSLYAAGHTAAAEWQHTNPNFDRTGQVTLKTLTGVTSQLSNTGQQGLQSSASPTVLSVAAGGSDFSFEKALLVTTSGGCCTTRIVLLTDGHGGFRSVPKSDFDKSFTYSVENPVSQTIGTFTTSFRWQGVNWCTVENMEPLTLPNWFNVNSQSCGDIKISPASEQTEKTTTLVLKRKPASLTYGSVGWGTNTVVANLSSPKLGWGDNNQWQHAVNIPEGSAEVISNLTIGIKLTNYNDPSLWIVTFPSSVSAQLQHGRVYAASFVIDGLHSHRVPFELHTTGGPFETYVASTQQFNLLKAVTPILPPP